MIRRLLPPVAGLALLTGCLGAGTVSPVDGGLDGSFPTVDGVTLAGEAVTLPDYFVGERVLVVLAFERGQRGSADSWTELYGDLSADHPTLGFYQVPLADAGAVWYRYYVNNTRLLDAWTHVARASTISVFTDLTVFMDRADLDDPFEVYALLLDETRTEIWRRRGPATPLTRPELGRVLMAAEPALPPPARE